MSEPGTSHWTKFGRAVSAGLSFDYRFHNVFSFVLIAVLSCSAYYVSGTSSGRYVTPFVSSPQADKLVASSDQRDVEDVSWADGAPKVAFIDFDSASVRDLRDAAPDPGGNGTMSLKEDVADILDWIRKGSRPRAVFLDLSPLYSRSSEGDKALAAAIRRWRDDPRAAPMAVFAGPSCFEVGDKGIPVVLSEGAFGEVMAIRADGTIVTGSRIMWSCPMYDGLELSYWSCAYSEAGDGLLETIALPSPAWFALAVKQADARFAGWMASDLEAARTACKDGMKPSAVFTRARGASVPKYTRTRFTFDPFDPARHKVDGNTILDILPAISILTSPDVSHTVLEDRFVVIGSSDTSQGFSDTLNTSVGRVPGSLVVATNMRHSWIAGFPKLKGWRENTLIVLLTCAIAYAAMIGARLFRMKLTAEGQNHILAVVVTNSGLVGLFCTSICLVLSVALSSSISGSDIIRVALSIVAIELIFTLGSISEDAHGQAR